MLQETVFSIDWQSVGGSSFIELVTGVNLAFIAIDSFQKRIKFVDRDCRDVVAQSCASIMDDNQRANSEVHFSKMLESVNRAYESLWYVCYGLGILSVTVGFVMLYFNWNCKYDFFLLMPILSYLASSAVIWLVIKWRCGLHCRALSIAQGVHKSDIQEVSEMAKGIEATAENKDHV